MLNVEGQYEYRTFDLQFIDSISKKEFRLAFYAYLGLANNMLHDLNSYQSDSSNQV